MQTEVIKRGREELRQVRKRSRALYWTVGLFSAFANLLMLTGPLYMLRFMTVSLDQAVRKHWSRCLCWWYFSTG